MMPVRPLRRTVSAPLFAAFALFLFTLSALPRGGAAAEFAPKDLVENFHAELLSVMKDAKTLGFKGRYDRLAPAVTGTFHLRLMTQITSGSHWRKAAEADKQALVSAFSKVSIGTYAARFTGFSGQHFETLGTKTGPQQTQLISTRLVNPDGDDVALTYVTKKIEGNWRVIDVVLASGISELALRKSEYANTLNQGGIAGLIASLNAKAAELSQSATGPATGLAKTSANS